MKTITIPRPLDFEKAIFTLTEAGVGVITGNACDRLVSIGDAAGARDLRADLAAEIDVLDASIQGYRAAYAAGKPEISDEAYDETLAVRALLAGARAALFDGEPTAPLPVDVPPPAGRPRIHHAAPILSLDNVRDAAGILSFGARVEAIAPRARLILEPKLDGVTLIVGYTEGRLTSAATRGDGFEGEDVLRTVGGAAAGLPEALPEDSAYTDFDVRGEVVIDNRTFAALAAEGYAKARNLVAGTLAAGDRDLARRRGLRFVVHGIERIGIAGDGAPTPARYSQAITRLGFAGFETLNPFARAAFTNDPAGLEAKAEELAAEITAGAIPYECDGVVIKADAFAAQEELGAHSTAPRWAVAYKWRKPGAATTIRGVEHSLAASGRITPVLLVDPVVVSGAEIRRVTGHNYTIAAGYAVGDEIEVERAGDVIPKAGKILREAADRAPIAPPSSCPACGGIVARGEDGEPRCAASEGGCAGIEAAALVKLAARDALDLPDVGPTAAEAIFSKYRTVAEVIAGGETPWLRQIGGVRAEKVIRRLAALREEGVDLARLLVGLGIPALGATKAKALARHFGSLDKLLEATVPDFVKAGMGPATAERIRHGFRGGSALEVIEALVSVGIMPNETPAETAPTGPLAGEVVCITGTLSRPRAEIAAMVEAAGGKIATSVGRSTTVLVAGAEAGSKLEAAKTRGVPVVTEEDILWVIGGGKRGEAWARK